MTEFVVDPSANSFSQSLQDLRDFKDSKPALQTWFDNLDSGTGETLLQLLAGFDTSLKYNNTVNRRETYRNFATNRSSVIAGAEDDGYSAFRGQNVHFTLTITPTVNTFISRFEPVGTVKDLDLIALEEKTLTIGTQTTLLVVAGEVANESITVGSSKIDVFRFLESSLVSEDIRLLLNGAEVEISEDIEDLLPKPNSNPPEIAKYVLISNSFDSVSAYYLNFEDFVNRYDTGDVLTLEYIKLKDFSYTFPQDFTFDFGVLDSLTVESSYLPPEEVGSIKLNSILFNQTRFAVKGRDDYIKRLRQLDPTLIDSNVRDITAAEMEGTYIKEVDDELVLLTPAEKDNLEAQLLDFRFYGNRPPPIIDPQEVNIEIDISIKFFPFVDSSSLEDDIAEIFAYDHGDNEINEDGRVLPREKKLEHVLDLSQMEHEFVNLPYVQIARLALNPNTWQTDTVYTRGQFVTPPVANGLIFINAVQGTSGLITPDFDVNAGDFVIEGISSWKSETEYEEGDLIVPTTPNNFIYRAKYVIGDGLSGEFEPDFPTDAGETILDNQVTWETVLPKDVPDFVVWQAFNENEVKIPLDWNEYLFLSYDGTVTQL
jgi:hypothetical protein